MSETIDRYIVKYVDLMGAPQSSVYEGTGMAIRIALECMGRRFTDVHIVDEKGQRYGPTEFNRLFSHRRRK